MLRRGGVIAYPTEGVFGLGCLPDDEAAVMRILRIKQRDVSKGLILIAANREQLDDWIDTDEALPSSATDPVTWIVPARARTPAWIRGQHATVAVRIVEHALAQALCLRAGSPLVSTSANLSGQPATKDHAIVADQFADQLDYVVPGSCGPAPGASRICDIETGKPVRLPST